MAEPGHSHSAGPHEIYLLRHGETEWNAWGRYQGRLDSPPTETGIDQALACANLLSANVPNVDALVSSPLGRARQTTDCLLGSGRYPEPCFDNRLSEVSLGPWDGLSLDDIDAGWPSLLDGTNQYDWYFRSPGGESFEQALARA
jgi:broad specificity phosphatase PhoE